MAATAQLFNQYVWLTELIYSSRQITFKEINHQWQQSSLNETHTTLPLRTFHRWRQEIEELFHIIIECDRTKNCYYIWNADDLHTNKTMHWLLNAFAVNSIIHESQALRDKILLEDMPSDARYLSPIVEAMRNGHVLRVRYKKFLSTSEKGDVFEMRPYCVKAFKLRWYMVGESSKHPGEIRVYALDRIVEMTTTEQTYAIPADFDAHAYFRDYFGVMKGDRNGEVKPEKVQIRVVALGADYLRSLPLHSSQKEVKRTKEYSIFEFYIAPTFDFIQELRTFGEEIQVLHPLSLAHKFKELGAKYSEMYSGL